MHFHPFRRVRHLASSSKLSLPLVVPFSNLIEPWFTSWGHFETFLKMDVGQCLLRKKGFCSKIVKNPWISSPLNSPHGIVPTLLVLSEDTQVLNGYFLYISWFTILLLNTNYIVPTLNNGIVPTLTNGIVSTFLINHNGCLYLTRVPESPLGNLPTYFQSFFPRVPNP